MHFSDVLDDVSLRRPRPHRLEKPITAKQSADESRTGCSYAFGTSSMQGWRKTMEDAHMGILGFGGDPCAGLFAVFDGHNGREVAEFAADNIPTILLNLHEYREHLYGQALRRSFLAVDEAILSGWPQSVHKYVDCSKKMQHMSQDPYETCGAGCAALACLVKDKCLHIANAGDCRAVLCRSGVAIQLSSDHKPGSDEERRRIEQAGGEVIAGRVGGRLNVARSLGDFAYKKDKNAPPEAQVITACADIVIHELTEEDEFVVLGCDGIWERRSPQEVIEFVKPRMDQCRQAKHKISSIAGKLLDAVVAPDLERTGGLGCDNMTCIIVDLARGKDGPRCQKQHSVLPVDAPVEQDSGYRPQSCSRGICVCASCASAIVIKLLGLTVVVALGLAVGLVAALVIGLAGSPFLILSSAGVTCYIFVFNRVYATLYIREWVVGIIVWLFVACFWLAIAAGAVRFTYRGTQLATFNVAGVGLAVFFYIIALRYPVKNIGKHLLISCGSASSPETVRYEHEEEALVPQGWSDLRKFAALRIRGWYYVVMARFWHDLVDIASRPTVTEPVSVQDGITVHNRTLKKIKVCVYAAEDCLCWVPLGGVNGSLVGFIPAEHSRTFCLATCNGQNLTNFRLKIFQPALVDMELACRTNVSHGDSFVFHDAEQLMKRSVAPAGRLRSKDQDHNQLTHAELGGCPTAGKHEAHCEGNESANACAGICADDVARAAGLRCRCACLERPSTWTTSVETCCHLSPKVPMSLTIPVRSPNSDEILLRNRSQQDIKALLFSADDYINFIPLVGKMTGCGDCILPDKDRFFNLKSVQAEEFTLKVYDVGADAKELTYLTVARGHTYTFCNSLLS